MSSARQQLLQDVRRLVVFSLGLQDQRFVIRNLQRILNQRLGLLQIAHGQIELAHAPVDFRNTQRRLGILRIGFLNRVILRQRRIYLVIVGKILGQPAHCIQIFMVQLNRLLVGRNGLLIVFLLLVGVAQRAV